MLGDSYRTRIVPFHNNRFLHLFNCHTFLLCHSHTFVKVSAWRCYMLQIQFFFFENFSLYWPWLGRPDFDISQKSLGLVYNQTLLWLGLLFSPLLVAIIVCKLFLKFYINKALLLHLCKPSCHIWRSAQTQTLYLVFTFVSILGVILTLGYIMTQYVHNYLLMSSYL